MAREELLKRYAAGERARPDGDLSQAARGAEYAEEQMR